MIVDVYEALIGLGLFALLRWLWILQGRTRFGAVLAVAAAVAFAWPWAWYADWAAVGRVALVAGVVGAVVLGYARAIAWARRAAAGRGGDR